MRLTFKDERGIGLLVKIVLQFRGIFFPPERKVSDLPDLIECFVFGEMYIDDKCANRVARGKMHAMMRCDGRCRLQKSCRARFARTTGEIQSLRECRIIQAEDEQEKWDEFFFLSVSEARHGRFCCSEFDGALGGRTIFARSI